ncbi:MAG: hypothetical protein CYPHOPRED_004460 [Cyphobasidiales sp. Tagirdzhanova-0007]|nr:MAG: hypothetical protein CYPHOPRED_004460 [Cyphobasidiales sp. Tagirdzhanova-0007]
MKVDSIPTNRNRQAFYSYRKRPSPSPSVCSSASSSAASASAAPARLSRKRFSPYKPSLNPLPARHKASRSDGLPSASAGPSKELEGLLATEYQEDILAYMSEMEDLTSASVELIDQQPELAWYMRPYLIDFLIEIHSQYRLRPETLCLAVNIADRYTSRRIVYKRHYQLVGCAALWIAAKFEDAKDRIPTVQDLCAMTCHAYDASAFIQMEGHVLSTLNWLIGHPTAESWLRVQSLTDPSMLSSDSKIQHVTRILMEITLFHRAFVPLKSSEIALGCLLLARFMLGVPRQTRDESEIAVRIAQMLDGHLADHLEQVSAIVIKKYALACFCHASTFLREWYLAGKRFDLHAWPSSHSNAASPAAAFLTPSSHCPPRRESTWSSIASSSTMSSSPHHSYGGSSSEDDEMPLTPNYPATHAHFGSEDDRARKPSPLAQDALQRNEVAAQKVAEDANPTAPAAAAASANLHVKLVPTSGPPTLLY